MKIILKSLLLVFLCLGCDGLYAQIILKENIHPYDKPDCSSNFYDINELSINQSSEYIKELYPLLKILSANNKAQMYVWDISVNDSTIEMCIQNWRYFFFGDSIHRKNIYGALRFEKGNDKFFFVRCNNQEVTMTILPLLFTRLNTMITFMFEYNYISPNEYILDEDISTKVICHFKREKLLITKFVYNNKVIKMQFY